MFTKTLEECKDPDDFIRWCEHNGHLEEHKEYLKSIFPPPNKPYDGPILSEILEEYYFHCWANMYLKENPRVVPQHDNPADYGLDEEFVNNCQKRYRALKKKEYEERETIYLSSRVYWSDRLRRADGWQRGYCLHYLRENEAELERIKNRLRFYSMPKQDLKMIDIKAVKEVPLDRIFEINNAGFFIHNPLREERSPSNSLHWNKKTNKWNDYGTGEYGDGIDLIMKINKCGLNEACKIILGHS
ncbi:hypothetical protein HGB13_00030 [bacterium]|nr:hypothetical protein [bacterium]